MSALDVLIFGQKVEVEDKENYVVIYIGGLPYNIPKDMYEKMKIK